MKEIEILLIDDFSRDNTLEILEKLKKEDSRIKIIKNNKKKGTLYSRSIGALNSRGKYIMSIDHDDLFTNNIFNICYKEANENNIDIVEFSSLILNDSLLKFNQRPNIPYFSLFKKDGKIIKQPKLSTFIYKRQHKNYKLIDALIWGKCIKTEIYKKALDLLGKEIYLQNICWSEDRIVNFALFRVASSFKFINYYGILHQRLISSIGNDWRKTKEEKIFNDELINVMSKYKILSNSSDKNIAYYEFKNLWESKSITLNKKIIDNIKQKLNNFQYISKNEKKKLMKLISKKYR